MTTDQLVTQARQQIYKLGMTFGPMWSAQVEAIIKAAIEEATKELRDANDNLFKVARKHSVENQKLKSQREIK